MKLSELIAQIGDENIEVQHLVNSSLRVKSNKKHGDTEITFATKHDLLNGGGKVGLVVWFDENEFKKAMKSE